MYRRVLTAAVALVGFVVAPFVAADVPRKPEVRASVEEFVKGAIADPKASEAKLKGKVVELSGPVSAAAPANSPWGVTLYAGKLKPADAFGVFAECEVPKDQREIVWLLAQGQKVKVVGTLQAVDKDRVRLADCTVTAIEPNTIPSVTAVDVAAAYVKDEKEASKTFGDRYNLKELFLEGVVKDIKKGKYGTLVFLQGAGDIPVRVQVADTEAQGLKAGDSVHLKTRCRGLWREEGAVLLFGHILKTDKK